MSATPSVDDPAAPQEHVGPVLRAVAGGEAADDDLAGAGGSVDELTAAQIEGRVGGRVAAAPFALEAEVVAALQAGDAGDLGVGIVGSLLARAALQLDADLVF